MIGPKIPTLPGWIKSGSEKEMKITGYSTRVLGLQPYDPGRTECGRVNTMPQPIIQGEGSGLLSVLFGVPRGFSRTRRRMGKSRTL